MENNQSAPEKEWQQLNMLADVARFADNPVALISFAGMLEWANEAFIRLYGSDCEKYLKDASEVLKAIHATDKQFFKDNRSVSYISHNHTPAGETKWIQTTLTPVFDKDDKIIRYIAVESDITKQKEQEEELRQQYENTLALTEHIESVVDYVEGQKREIDEQKQAIEEAKKRTETVLSQVLPYEVAVQLRNKGYAQPRHYKKVTVMFISIVNYDELTELYATDELVDLLHSLYSQFDEIIESHYVEKIKTVYGSYLCAGGVPLRNKSNPIDVALSALKICNYLVQLNRHFKSQGKPEWKVCITAHTGEVIAGVVGKRKLTYDIWGDAVQATFEIQKNAPSCRITLSGSVVENIDEYFQVIPCHSIDLRTRGTIDLYHLERILPRYAADEKGILPNQEFLSLISRI